MINTWLKTYQTDYESDAKASYLVLKLNQESKVLLHQVEMICNNPTAFYLPISIREKNNDKYCYYDITSKQKLSHVIQRKKLTKKEFLNILMGITKGIIQSSNFFLSEKSFVLSDEYIYVSSKDYQASLVYLPLPEENHQYISDLRSLVMKLVATVSIEESINDNFLHHILVAINREDFSVIDLNTLVVQLDMNTRTYDIPSEKKDDKNSKEKMENTTYSKRTISIKNKFLILLSQLLLLSVVLLLSIEFGLLRNNASNIISLVGILLFLAALECIIFRKLFSKKSFVERVTTKKQKLFRKKTPDVSNQIGSINMNKREIYNFQYEAHIDENSSNNNKLPIKVKASKKDSQDQEYDLLSNDTMVIEEGLSKSASLVSLEDGIVEKISISKKSFILGKIKDQADYILTDKSISRVHAEIICKEGEHYLVDLNSKNGTFLNGIKIFSNKPYQLKDGDFVRLANKEFTFKFS